jgi:hypothetical protein
MSQESAGGGPDEQDAARWWQAYLLAENDQVDELRERAVAGDEHARRQLAGWLSDRARTQEAIEVIRPLADAGDEGAQLWLARWLAEQDQPGELRQRADEGDYHALLELAGWLAGHDRLDDLRFLVAEERELLANWLARQPEMKLVRLAADLGDDDAQRRVERWVDRLRDRATAGDGDHQHLPPISARRPPHSLPPPRGAGPRRRGSGTREAVGGAQA